MFQEAIALQKVGRLPEAEKLYRALLKLNPAQFDCLHALGRLCFRDGRPQESMKWLQRAVAENRRSADALCDLGAAASALGRHDEAIQPLRRALSLSPEHALARFNMGTALNGAGRPEEAIAHFERTIAADPGFAEAFDSLGLSLAALNRGREALASHDAAIAIRPSFVQAYCNAGLVLLALNRPAEALEYFHKALALNSRHPDAHFGLGTALEGLGRLHEARQAYETATELAPGRGVYHRGLADCTRYAPGHRHLACMETLERDPSAMLAAERVHLHAALAKAYGDLGDIPRSARHMLEGNRRQRQRVVYDEAATLGQIKRVAEVFTPQLLREKHGLGAASAAPIFVVGMPRSGSTLIEQILASHPQVHGAGEIYLFGDAVASLGGGHFGSDSFLDQVPLMSGAQLRQIGERYVRDISALADGKDCIVNKLPGNFIALGLIHLALPNAIIVHSRRDPIDTSFSRFSKIFVPGQAYSYELGELGRYHRSYVRLMAHWRDVLPAGAMIEVDYEAVVADLEGQARRLIAACGLEWDDACLAFHQARRPVMTPSKSQVRQPIYATAVGRWRPYQEMLRPLIEALEA